MFQTQAQVQTINSFSQIYPILLIFYFYWSIFGIAHCISRKINNDTNALFSIILLFVLEGPAVWVYTIFLVFVVYPFKRFVRYIKSV